MPIDAILPQQWMHVPRETREKIAEDFHVGRSGVTEIRDSDVITDGRTREDLAVLTSTAMAEYVGSEDSFGRLWELTIAKAHSELHLPVGIIAGPAQVVEMKKEEPILIDSTKPIGETLETKEEKAERIRNQKRANIQKARDTRMANYNTK
jgi:hypothetical protein